MDSNHKIESFLLLAKGVKGKALADLIVKATAEPGIYGFGEFLQLDNVRELSSHPDTAHTLDLLLLFANGTWSDYRASPHRFPALTLPAQQHKLKILTILSLAASCPNGSLSYNTLARALDMDLSEQSPSQPPSSQPTTTSTTITTTSSLSSSPLRQLEELLIECMYNDLLIGRMDQEGWRVNVTWVVGRDVVGVEGIRQLRESLTKWLQNTKSLLTMLHDSATHVTKAAEERATADAEFAARIEAAKVVVTKEVEQSAGPDLPSMFGEEGMEMIDTGEDAWGMGGGGGMRAGKRRR